MHAVKEPHSKFPKDPLSSFLGLSFQDPHSLEKAKQQVENLQYPREQLASILEGYNRYLGNDQTALENAKKIGLSNSCCVVTGQQLGMMGGPIYTILKGISCLLVARQTGAVPIFWLATEDHDIAEIDHTYLIDYIGNLKRFHLSLARDGAFVEDILLSDKNIDEIESFYTYLGLEITQLPKVGESYSHFMISVLMRLFMGTGMVFLEPKLLRPLAIPFFSSEIRDFQKIQQVLQDTTKHLEEAGGHPGIQVDEPTNLFYKNTQGKRLKIRFDGSFFTIGQEKYSQEELLLKIEKQPELFSTNVAARPVLQNTLLPTIAYIAGPSELAYHRQLKEYHELHEVAMPCLIPRLSATFIPAYAANILETCALKPWNEIPHHWPDVMPEIEEGSEGMSAEWLESANRFFGSDLSKTAIERYVKLGSRKLVHRACKQRLREKGLPSSGLHLLRNLIHPHNNSQERLLNWWGFQAKSENNLVNECLRQLAWDSDSHYYIYL